MRQALFREALSNLRPIYADAPVHQAHDHTTVTVCHFQLTVGS